MPVLFEYFLVLLFDLFVFFLLVQPVTESSCSVQRLLIFYNWMPVRLKGMGISHLYFGLSRVSNFWQHQLFAILGGVQQRCQNFRW